MNTTDSPVSGKVILIGSSGVGKTSLITYFLTNTFTQQELSTVAPASCSATIQVEDSSVDLQIWDTAGQEKFQSISQMFYRNADIAFVCFTQETFDTIENWIERIRAESPKCLLFLVVTKADLLSTDDLSSLQNRCFSVQEQVGASYTFITSSSTGLGIRDLFQFAGNEIHSLNKPVETVSQTVLVPSENVEQKQKCKC